MKRLFCYILVLISSGLAAQDSTAYSFFNSAYADSNYTYILTEKAFPTRLNPATEDSVFIGWCSLKIPDAILKEMLSRESQSFKWNQNKLRNTIVIPDSLAERYVVEKSKDCLSLSAPLFDQAKTYAIVYESLDAGSCIHSGPVLYQYKNKKWIALGSHIISAHVFRGHAIPRKQWNTK
jgi:hypothetical protein